MPNEGAHGDRYSLPRGYASLYGKGVKELRQRGLGERSGVFVNEPEKRTPEPLVPTPTPPAGVTVVPGPFVGVSPKNFPNDDLRLWEELNESLTWHGGIDAHEIEVTVRRGVAKLSGRVPTREQRELVESVAKEIPGIKTVKNRLKLPPPKMGDKDYHNIAS